MTTPISTEAELRELIGEPLPRVQAKMRTRLHELDRAWLAASPFCVVATADADGRCDASPKGDPPGQLAHVIDDHTLALAERPGNRLADGYRNILANPHVGLNFFIPGRGDTLRINGRAQLVRDGDFFDDLVVQGHRPVLAMVVDVEEVFHHCAKAFLRSKLWDPSTWDPTGTVPRRALLAHQLDSQDRELAELEEYYGPSYGAHIYG